MQIMEVGGFPYKVIFYCVQPSGPATWALWSSWTFLPSVSLIFEPCAHHEDKEVVLHYTFNE